ncbi:ell-associated factor Eaf isoform X1 [Culex pipiens pallens]|uniref:ell-associated factor Eaf isoform X1 n=1 Tax=Culex pipiens pallens TaxID=42434 RepID=UPI001954C5EC|nr:ell-associated factor Eaf isoform X1 [Culex pipiens pallens]
MRKMDNRLKLDSEVRELKLGSTFTNPNPRTVFHTLKYDFKPASVDTSKPATLEVGTNKQVTVTVPHNDSSGVPNTVFKGNQRDYTRKECVLIIDRVTGEITLEKLNSNVQVKKTRTENKVVQPPPPPPQIKVSENSTARLSSRTKITTGSRKNNPISLVPKHSPLQNSPSYPNKSPLSAPVWNANNTQQTLPSIPLIGLDDGNDILPVPSSSVPAASQPVHHQQQQSQQHQHQHQQQQQQSQHHGHNSLGLPSMNNIGGGGSSHHNNSHNSHNNSNNSHGVNQQQPTGMNQHHQAQQQQQHNPYSNNNHHNSNSNNNNSESNNVEIGLPSLLGQASPPRDTGFSTGLLSSSSSDSSGSSDSDSGSESDSTTEDNNDSPVKESIFDIGPTRSDPLSNSRPLPTHILSQDLCLSESNSDSD